MGRSRQPHHQRGKSCSLEGSGQAQSRWWLGWSGGEHGREERTEVAGAGGASAWQDVPGLGRTHPGAPLPLQLTLGLGCSATRDCFRNRGGKRRKRQPWEAQALPSKLVLELFAVHMPICFVIAGLFLEASGVSRKPESVDCVSWVRGV